MTPKILETVKLQPIHRGCSFVVASLLLAAGIAPPAAGQQPEINSGGVVNDANYRAPVAPGSIAAAFGSFPVSSPAGAVTIPLANSLDDLSLVFGGNVSSPLFFVSSGQVNFQVPWDLAGQTQTSLSASLSALSSPAQTVYLAPYAPGIFSTNAEGTGQGAIVDTSYRLVDSSNPAIAGTTYIQIYCTGLGTVSNQPSAGGPAPTSPLAETPTTPTVWIGNVAAKVIFSGLAPGYVGLYQVNALVPADTPGGDAVPVYLSIGGATSNTVTIAVKGPPQPDFNALTTSVLSFDPTNIAGMQCVTTAGVRVGPPPCGSNLVLTGYQGGDMVNGLAIYPPWSVPPTASASWEVLNSAIIWYNGGSFNEATSWGVHDMDADAGYSSTCPNTSSSGYVNYCPGGYNSGIVVGDNYYLVPGEDASLPVYVMINTAGSGGLSDSANYSYVNGSVVAAGSALGAATGFYDGRYVHYIPSIQTRWVRHDTTQDTGNKLSSSPSAWASVDLSSDCGYPSESWLGGTWDGHRYGYGLPETGPNASSILVRIDTTAPFGCSAFTEFDLSKLGEYSQPQVQGSGSIDHLRGFAGAVIAIDGNTTNGTAWLYAIPWETYKTSFTGAQTLGNTAFRVICGTYTDGTFTAADITSPSALYEVVDLDYLLTDPLFASIGWTKIPGMTFTSATGPSVLAGQPTIGGFQLGWFNPTTGRVIFNAADGAFEVEFDPSKHLWDPTGTYIGLALNPALGENNYGGPASLGPTGATVIYPSTPSPTIGGHEMVQISGL